MNPAVTLIIGLACGAALGAAVAVLVGVWRGRSRTGDDPADPALLAAQHARAIAELRAQEQAERAQLGAELSAAEATASGLREQVIALQQQYREMVDRARDDEVARRAREQTEGRVLQALAPVRESLQQMQTKVGELEQQRSLQHGEISEQLRAATESEERLRSTAESLASALRSNSTRGVWGETQLRRVVEAAGLLERVDFDVQTSISSDAGAGRPDLIVHLPGGKTIAVDAKVPFTAYLEASAISTTATGAEGTRRDALMSEHAKAVREHIGALATRAYWKGLESSPQLVVAFIPSESLVSSALAADPTLMEFAFSKHVALASPVTLWSVLKTVAFSWQQDVLTEDAKHLFDLSRELHGRLATTAQHIEKLGRSIESTIGHYNRFVGSLERQVLPTARKLTALDESKVLGVLTPIEESPRALTAFELVSALDVERTEPQHTELQRTDLQRAELPTVGTPTAEETRKTA